MEQTQVTILAQPPPTATMTMTWNKITDWNLSLTKRKQIAKGRVIIQQGQYILLGDLVRRHHLGHSQPPLVLVMAQKRPPLMETRARLRLCQRELEAVLHPQLYNSPIFPGKLRAVL
jgi:hypothetical protein